MQYILSREKKHSLLIEYTIEFEMFHVHSTLKFANEARKLDAISKSDKAVDAV